MEVHVVHSREMGVVMVTTDIEKATKAKADQIYSEECGGGRPGVGITTKTLVE